MPRGRRRQPQSVVGGGRNTSCIRPRVRHPLALLACAIVVGGCGSATARSHPVARWQIEAPNFPPPEPAARPRLAAKAPAAKPAPTRGPAIPAAGAPANDTGALTDAEVRAELKSAFGKGGASAADNATLTAAGLATVPPTAPNKLQAMILAANEVSHKPYVYGGGHGRFKGEVFSDSAYDCSGSVSYALAAAGFLDAPTASGGLERFGKPGPGKWVSIFANAGHTFMYVAGLRFDTSGRDGPLGSRWQTAPRSTAGFIVRHPPGL